MMMSMAMMVAMGDGEDDDVDDDGAFADDGDGHDQRRWKEFDVRARAWPAWYYLIGIHAAGFRQSRARAAREGPFERNVKNHWFFKVQHVRANRNFRRAPMRKYCVFICFIEVRC